MGLHLQGVFDRWLFGPGSQQRTPLGRLRHAARYPYAMLRDLLSGQLNLHAMGLVYATLLALIPLVAFSFSILKAFGAHRELEPLIYEFFAPMGASAADLTRRVMDFADKVRSGLVGTLGLALLLWTLIGTMKKVEDSFNFVWRVEQPRSFARRFAEYLGLLVIGPVLVAAVVGATQLAGSSRSLRLLSSLPLLDNLWNLTLLVTPYLVVSALFSALYLYIPNTRVAPRSAVIGGIGAGVLWAAVGKIFTTFVLASARLTMIFAGFAIVVAALVWTYLGWLILLLGAQLSFYVQNPNYLRLGLTQLRLSNVETERLSLAIMYLVGEAHERGGTRWNSSTLAARLGLPGIAVTRIAEALASERLLVSAENDDLLPGRSLGQITLLEILEVARNHAGPHVPHSAAEVPAVDRFCAGLEASWRERCGSQTLEELIDSQLP